MTTHKAKPPTFLVLLLHFDEFFANRVIVQCEVGSSRIDGLVGYDSPARHSVPPLQRQKEACLSFKQPSEAETKNRLPSQDFAKPRLFFLQRPEQGGANTKH